MQHAKGDRSPARCPDTSREDRTAWGTLADPEQDRRSLRAAWGDPRSARSVLPGGADLENARGEDRGRRSSGGLHFSTAGAPRARTQLGHRAPLLKRRSAPRRCDPAPETTPYSWSRTSDSRELKGPIMPPTT